MAFQKKPKVEEMVIKTERPTTLAERFKAIQNLSDILDKKNDTTNSLVKLGAKVGQLLPSISTGLPTFDFGVIGTGGLPKGRIIEMYGNESSGKTSFALHIIAECQKAGGIAVFIDAEHSLDVSWAATLGVDVNKLVISQPNSGEQALDAVDKLVETQAVDLVVIDSVTALVPEAELAGEIGQQFMGLQSRLMSQAMRILTGKCSKNKVTLLFINQLRDKIGVLYGNPSVTTGGRALKFYSSVRIEVKRKEEIKNGNELLGHTLHLKAAKNKCGVPFRECTVDLLYFKGFDQEGSWVEYADTLGVLERKGSWFVMNGTNVANGLPAMKLLLKSDPEAFAKVKAEVEKKIKEGPKEIGI